MGYIIPVQPIQTQLYANRMLMDEYNFSYISGVQGVRMKSLFDKHLENQEQPLEEKEEEKKELFSEKDVVHPPLFKSFIQPNPVNLSKKIAEINGKGNSINLYI